MPREIPLTRGFVALVDDADYERVAAHKWFPNGINPRGPRYAMRKVTIDGVRTSERMHRFILPPPVGCVVDHINGNSLDNRRENLRICTQAQNCGNKKRNKNNKTGFKGVSRNGAGYRAVIMVDFVSHRLGTFSSVEEAARAYDAAALRFFGEFARVNFAAPCQEAA